MSDVLILTGRIDTRWTWRPMMAALTGHRVGVEDRMSHHAFPTLRDEVMAISHHVARHHFERPILVAHSISAFAAEAYARHKPVAALLLINPDCELDVLPRGNSGRAATRATFHAAQAFGEFLDATGAGNMLGPVLWRLQVRRTASRRPSWPVTQAAQVAYRAGHVTVAAIAEELAYREMAADLCTLRRRTSPPAVPVMVLTARRSGVPVVGDRATIGRHRQLARTFPAGVHTVVSGSKQLMQLDRPDAIAKAIRRVAAHTFTP